MDIVSLPAFADNYIHVMRWGSHAFVVDPGDAAVVLEYIKAEGLELNCILVTHSHRDHADGIDILKKKSKASVIGPNDSRICGVDRTVHEGEELVLGPYLFTIFEVPGHTTSDIAYYLENEHCLFSGDVLFTGGCGRVFEGTARQMFSSLQKILALPDETNIYCGHEYTVQNLRFALSIEPENSAVQARLDEAETLRAAGKSTVPASLGLEKKTNPFLRCHEQKLKSAVGMAESDPVDVFAKIRRLKDSFSV